MLDRWPTVPGEAAKDDEKPQDNRARTVNIGRLDKGLDEARARTWTVVDMRRDWAVVFPFDKK